MEGYDISGNIQKLFDEQGLQDILLSVEEYFDNMDLYVFENWIDGEIVEGPVVSKYWVSVTLKYNMDKMPDPRGAFLFNNQGTKVQVRTDKELVPRQVMGPEDLGGEANALKQKLDEVPVMLVKFTIPRRLVDPASVEEYEILDSEEDAAEPAPQPADDPLESEADMEDGMDGMEDEEMM